MCINPQGKPTGLRSLLSGASVLDTPVLLHPLSRSANQLVSYSAPPPDSAAQSASSHNANGAPEPAGARDKNPAALQYDDLIEAHHRAGS